MIKAKKSLGQNFLIDEYILDKIVNVTKVKDQVVLEVGPGTGNLTSHLVKNNPKKLYVIEKDENLVSVISKKFGNEITIIHKDILKFNEKSLSNEKVLVFGNLPYNISTEILCKWILNLDKENFWFSNLVLMFQKEVANRIISDFNTSSYGRLSILANWKMKIDKITDIEPASFNPIPKVRSSLLLFTPKKEFYDLRDPKNLEHITNIFFSQRRKMIKKPLKILFKNFNEISNILSLKLELRPQNLDFITYYKICKMYEASIN